MAKAKKSVDVQKNAKLYFKKKFGDFTYEISLEYSKVDKVVDNVEIYRSQKPIEIEKAIQYLGREKIVSMIDFALSENGLKEYRSAFQMPF